MKTSKRPTCLCPRPADLSGDWHSTACLAWCLGCGYEVINALLWRDFVEFCVTGDGWVWFRVKNQQGIEGYLSKLADNREQRRLARAAWLLHYGSEMSIADVASELGVSEAQVEKLIAKKNRSIKERTIAYRGFWSCRWAKRLRRAGALD